MKLDLTEEETQKVINAQRREIGELKGRLTRAHIVTSYMDSKFTVWLQPQQINAAITHLKHLLHLAQCGNPEYDEDELERNIKLYEDTKKEKDYNEHYGVRMSHYDFRFLFVAMRYDERAARQESERIEQIRKYLWKEGEPVPPTHFSSHGTWM